jgi:hypothetical protein
LIDLPLPLNQYNQLSRYIFLGSHYPSANQHFPVAECDLETVAIDQK